MNKFLNANLCRITTLIIFISTIFFVIEIYWSKQCEVFGCENVLRDGFLSPTKDLTFYLSFVILPFLFLPQRYFRNFFIHFITWGSVLTLVLIAGTKTTTMIDRMDMVYVSVVFWVAAATFSVYRTRRNK